MDPCLSITLVTKPGLNRPGGGSSLVVPLSKATEVQTILRYEPSGLRGFVIEDGVYEIVLSCPAGIQVANPCLYVADNKVGKAASPPAMGSKGEKIFRFVPIEHEDEALGWRPFLLCHDWIRAVVVNEGGDRTAWSSGFFSCRCRDDGSFRNLQSIVSTLVDPDEKDYPVINWMSLKQSSEPVSMDKTGGFVRGRLRIDRPKTLNSFSELVETVRDCYTREYSFFRTRAHHKVSTEKVLVPFFGVRSVTGSDVSWLMQNAGRLAETDFETGISFQGRHYLPDRMQATRRVKHFDFLENRIVVSFLDHVVRSTETTAERLRALLAAEKTEIDSVFEDGSRYVAPLGVVRKMQQQVYSTLAGKLSSLLDELRIISRQYKDVLSVSEVPMRGLPRMTKIFQEVPNYRSIYDAMRKWFRFGEFSLAEESRLLGIKKLDRLFEHYSLFVILDVFRRNGFFPQDETTDLYSFRYDFERGSGRTDVQENETEINNTYRLFRGETEVTVFYQCGIFSPCQRKDSAGWQNNPNGIDLVFLPSTPEDKNISRIGFWKKYVTPDFLLKIHSPGSLDRYVVLDSKFAEQTRIQTHHSSEMFYKYVRNIRASSRNAGVVSLIVLQGRASTSASAYRFSNPQFLLAADYYIVPLTSQEETRNALWSVLSPWIEG